MNNSASKKSSAANTLPGTVPVTPSQPATAMSVATALTYFDFSQFPPVPKSTQADLGDALVHLIGVKLAGGLPVALIQNDTDTFIQCYQALHFCLAVNMETYRLDFGPSSKVAFLMTAYQAAVLFNRNDMITALFKTCLASPEHPIRAGISTPVSMITHAFTTGQQQGSPEEQAAWMKVVDNMISAFVDRLTEVDQEELCPTTGVVFDLCNKSVPGQTRDGLMRLCNAMSTRYTKLMAQGTNAAQADSTQSQRL